MTHVETWPDRAPFARSIHSTLLAFPIACFSMTVVTDIAYIRSFNMMWVHFSEWLLLAGAVFGGLSLLFHIGDRLLRKVRPAWSAILMGVVVLLLATLNSLIHTADGWTAVMPWGLTISVLTVIAMIITGWFGRRGAYHV